MVKSNIAVAKQVEVFKRFKSNILSDVGKALPCKADIYKTLLFELPGMTAKAIQTSINRNLSLIIESEHSTRDNDSDEASDASDNKHESPVNDGVIDNLTIQNADPQEETESEIEDTHSESYDASDIINHHQPIGNVGVGVGIHRVAQLLDTVRKELRSIYSSHNNEIEAHIEYRRQQDNIAETWSNDKDELKEKLRVSDGQVTEVLESNENLEAELADVKQTVQILKESRLEICRSRSEYYEKIQKLEEIIAEQDAVVAIVHREKSDLVIKINTANDEKIQFQSDLSTLQERCRVTIAENAKLAQDLKDSDAARSKQADGIVELEERCRATIAENAKLAQDLKDSDAARSKQADRIVELEERCRVSTSKKAKLVHELKESDAARSKQADNVVESKKDKLVFKAEESQAARSERSGHEEADIKKKKTIP